MTTSAGTASANATRRRIPELDGIRGLAILLVIVWHYVAAPNAKAPVGSLGQVLHRIGMFTWSGVDLFFVLSGFLIGGILVDARDSRSYFTNFYLRRTFRILPLYLIFCGIGVVIIRLNPGLIPILGQPMPTFTYATFTQNLWLAHHSWDVYMGVTWSLAVEEQFYLTLPLVIRYVPRNRLLPVVAGLAMASAVGRSLLYLHYGPGWGVAAYTLMPCRADALMLGVLGALALRDPKILGVLANRWWPLPAAVAASGLVVAVLFVKGWDMQTRPMSTLGYTALSLFYLSLLLLAVIKTRGLWARTMRLPPLMYLGNLAYCLYLVHGPALEVTGYLLHGQGHRAGADLTAGALSLVVSIGLAHLSWRYLESAMVAAGHRYAEAASSRAGMEIEVVERPRPARSPRHPAEARARNNRLRELERLRAQSTLQNEALKRAIIESAREKDRESGPSLPKRGPQ